MGQHADIQACLARVERVFEARPETALSTNRVHAHLDDGLAVRTEEDGHVLYADMPEVFGGSGQHASPGVLGRACIASCIAMGVKLAAARRGLDFTSIEVDLSMDWDHRGMIGDDSVYPGPTHVQVQVSVTCEAADADIQAALDAGLAADPWLLALERPHAVEKSIAITQAV